MIEIIIYEIFLALTVSAAIMLVLLFIKKKCKEFIGKKGDEL